MRLLNVHTKKLTGFFDSEIPPYAILSHRWGQNEVTFQDLNTFDSPDWEPAAVNRTGPGLLKIVYTCLEAKTNNLEWVWVDTCCIDKTSSAELSEAINSMYAWYRDSAVCYAYLDDVRSLPGRDPAEFTSSRWFTRGWTLQELLAPWKLIFFGIDWKFLGDRRNLSELVSQSTNIPERIIKHPSGMRSASIASRMSWAAGRRTTRVEDMAYSLLGIFNVNMPLLYGEGKKAFIRLQEEILRDSDDQSIFAWHWWDDSNSAITHWFSGPLADSPARFEKSGNIIPLPSTADKQPYAMTNKGLRIEIDILDGKPAVAILECHYDNDLSGLIGIPLAATTIPSFYMRTSGDLSVYRLDRVRQLRAIYLVKSNPLLQSYKTCRLDSDTMSAYGFDVVEVAPEYFPFNWKGQTMKFPPGSSTCVAAFKFHNPSWDHEPVILFALATDSNEGFLRISRIQGEETLQQLLEKEVKTGELFSHQSLPFPPPRNSTNGQTTFTIDASVKKEIDFRREIFVVRVGITRSRDLANLAKRTQGQKAT